MIYRITLKQILLYIVLIVLQLMIFKPDVVVALNLTLLIYILFDLKDFDKLTNFRQYFKGYDTFASIFLYLTGFLLFLVDVYLTGCLIVILTTLVFYNKNKL